MINVLFDENFFSVQFDSVLVDHHAGVDWSQDDVGVVPLHAEHVGSAGSGVDEKTDLVMQYLEKVIWS